MALLLLLMKFHLAQLVFKFAIIQLKEPLVHPISLLEYTE